MRNMKSIETFYVIMDGNCRIEEYHDRREALHYYHLYGGKREGLRVLAAATYVDTAGERIGQPAVARRKADAVSMLRLGFGIYWVAWWNNRRGRGGIGVVNLRPTDDASEFFIGGVARPTYEDAEEILMHHLTD